MENKLNNWVESLNNQIDFYEKSSNRSRIDNDFDWKWWFKAEGIRGWAKRTVPFIYKYLRIINGLRGTHSYSKLWFNNNATALFETREALEDDLSKIIFDNHLLLKAVYHSKFYFSRINYDDFFNIKSEKLFESKELPNTYGGIQMKEFTISLAGTNLKIIGSKLNIDLINYYRQYFVKRDGLFLGPQVDDIVFDCGACIGEISTLFAGLVGSKGQVHTFDPIPLHSKFIKLHSDLNEKLSGIIIINELAVDSQSFNVHGNVADTKIISPGGLSVDTYNSISLDEYFEKSKLTKIDYIKMDIEGYEIQALMGATNILKLHKPKLAICCYHKPEDLWEIPRLLRQINPDYKIYFGHHTPVAYESVFYAC